MKTAKWYKKRPPLVYYNNNNILYYIHGSGAYGRRNVKIQKSNYTRHRGKRQK